MKAQINNDNPHPSTPKPQPGQPPHVPPNDPRRNDPNYPQRRETNDPTRVSPETNDPSKNDPTRIEPQTEPGKPGQPLTPQGNSVDNPYSQNKIGFLTDGDKEIQES